MDLSPQDLRHWFCSALIAYGEDGAHVAQQARHKAGPSFTYKQDIHLFQERRQLDREAVLGQFAEVLSAGRAYPVLTSEVKTARRTDGAKQRSP